MEHRVNRRGIVSHVQNRKVISYANCPVIWCSKLQTDKVLSTTECKYIALSQSLRGILLFTELLKKIREIIQSNDKRPEVHCRIFEDNKGFIDLIESPWIRHRTKYIALKYHHFRSSVKNKLVSIRYAETGDQISNIFTKVLNDDQFYKLRTILNGWQFLKVDRGSLRSESVLTEWNSLITTAREGVLEYTTCRKNHQHRSILGIIAISK